MRELKKHTQFLPQRVRYGRAYSNAKDGEESYTDDEREFLTAIDRYKTTHGLRDLTPQQVLEVAHSLGYRRCEQ